MLQYSFRTGNRMHNLGSENLPCECAIKENLACDVPDTSCNCNANDDTWRMDRVVLYDYKQVPLKAFTYKAAGVMNAGKTANCLTIQSGLIIVLRPANERRCYFVTTSLIGWAQA